MIQESSEDNDSCDPRERASNTGKSWKRLIGPKFFWLCLVLAGVCIAAVAWLAVASVPLSDFSILARLLVLGLLVVFVTASLATNKDIPWQSRSWADWRSPKVLGSIALLLLGAVSFVKGMAGIISPPSSADEVQREINARVEKIDKGARRLQTGQIKIAEQLGVGRASRIRQHIDGVWGEEGCNVTYRLRLQDRSVVMRSLRSPAGVEPYEAEYTVNEDSDRSGPSGERLSVMETREERGWYPGFNVTFTYATNGLSETLFWDHRKLNVNGLRLVRCQERRL